jgi:hypothetical protein
VWCGGRLFEEALFIVFMVLACEVIEVDGCTLGVMHDGSCSTSAVWGGRATRPRGRGLSYFSIIQATAPAPLPLSLCPTGP